MTARVLLLPWVHLHEPLPVGDVTFHPLVGAIEIAGEWRDQLKLLGSIYVDGYSLALTCSRDEPAPRLNPAVAFVPDDDFDARHVRDAVDVLMLATILENGVMRSNGATFEMALRRLDGEPGWLVDLSPTMYGTNLNGIDATTYFEMRPPRAGKFHQSRRSAMVDALWAAVNGPCNESFREIFDTLRTATSESQNVSMDLARSLMAKAATLLVHQPGISDRKKPMLTRLRKMLAQFLSEPTGDEYGFHIARVWQAVRDHRNEFWHPSRSAPVDTFPFMGQRLVTPMLLALRMVHALVAARLVELRCAPNDGEVSADVYAIERWIATLGPDLEAGLEPITDAASMLKRKERVDNTESAFWKSRTQARFETAAKRAVAAIAETG